jgi:hypothetical protein
MPDYRVVKPSEREDLIAGIVAEIANSVLHIRLPGRSFIEEIYNGDVADITRPESILGLFYLHRIYVVKDLADAELVRVVTHELRHSWQIQNQKYCGLRQREVDADLFAREFSIYLGQPTESRIAARLVTAYCMKCRPISPYVRDLLLNKGAWNNGTH